MSRDNPWTARFVSLLDPDVIRRLTRLVPEPFTNLDELPLEVACKAIAGAFKELFIPTTQTISILADLVGIALAHSQATYPNAQTFMKGVYAKESPVPDLSVIVCFTGLAGVGKSHVVKALARLLGEAGRVLADPDHSKFLLLSAWFLNVREKTTAAKMFLALLGQEDTEADALSGLEASSSEGSRIGKKRKERHDITPLLKSCRFRAFRDGVSLLPVDEFQFATRSERAHALVTSMLFHLAAIGPPLIFVANYSLGHRLMNRPQEDLQRLLERRIILLPDPATSVDWLDTVRACRNIAPEVFVFNPDEIAEDLHGWTAGLKRLLGRLLIIAYRRARATGKCVGLAEIEWAYHSSDYGVDRNDVNIIHQQNVTNVMARKDLWCPFDLPVSEKAQEEEDGQTKSLKEMGTRLVTSALTQEERELYNQLQKAARNSTPSTKAKPVSIKKKGSVSFEELRQGEAIFRALNSSRKGEL